MNKLLKKILFFLEKYELVSLGKNNKIFILLTFLMLASMIFGSVFIGTANLEFLKKVDFLFLSDIKIRFESTGIDILISSFASLFFAFLIIQLAAFSCWGALAIPIITIFKGLSFGISSGYLYLIYGLKGIAFYILILLPGVFVSSVATILISAHSIKFSSKIANKILRSKITSEDIGANLKMHFKKSGYALFLLLISSLLDTAFAAMFSRFFEF